MKYLEPSQNFKNFITVAPGQKMSRVTRHCIFAILCQTHHSDAGMLSHCYTTATICVPVSLAVVRPHLQRVDKFDETENKPFENALS